MGYFDNGKWIIQEVNPKNKSGEFIRNDTTFRDTISNEKGSRFPAEKDRYHLYISHACPWAHRTMIFRKLKQLEDLISISVTSPYMKEMGWSFNEDFTGVFDPDGINYLQEVYLKADPYFSGRVTVPILWDKKEKKIVNNESSEIIRMFNSEFNHLTGNNIDFYPMHLREQIDEINDFVYNNINNGVYKVGFANSQEAYKKNFDSLFMALNSLDEKLAFSQYLVGDQITEADWRLFTTLVRFDAVYVGHFKCNQRRIEDYPNLSRYLKELYHVDGIAETVNINHIKTHYYGSHETLNPSGIIPEGPNLGFLDK